VNFDEALRQIGIQVAGGDEGFVFEFEASDNNNSG
jgi:hypothetical protein